MSRCFPFPPPGYEKKARPDEDANLLIKENHKEKKQKKEKKDKEKKERRDKDKEKNSEKHREKKEKKHKHKDKEDKNRDKGEKKASEEKNIAGLSDNQNSKKFGQSGTTVGETQNFRPLLELRKKVRNDNGAKEQIVERISVTDLNVKQPGHQKFKDKSEENRIPNGQCVKVNAAGLANGFFHNFPPEDQKDVEGGINGEGKVMEKQKERKDTNKQKISDGHGDKHKDGDGEKKSKSKDKKRKKEKEKAKEEKVKNLSNPVPSKLRGSVDSAVDCKNDRGSYLFKESNANNGNLSKRKEPEMDGSLNGIEFQHNKLPRPMSSSHQVIQTGSRIDTSNTGIQFALEKEATVQKRKSHSKVSSSVSVFENGRKLEMRQTAINFAPERQEEVSNHNKANDSVSSLNPTLVHGNLEPCQTVTSFSDMEQGIVTNHTLNEKVLLLHPVVENQRKLESGKFNNLTSPENQGTVSKPKYRDRESQINGFLEPKFNERTARINGLLELNRPSAGSLRSPSAPEQLEEIVETRMKPPHPDAKYLSDILSVPKVEWSDVDEQEWLFSSEDHQSKRPKNVSTIIESSKQVWAEVLQIESADVIALPYVIPY